MACCVMCGLPIPGNQGSTTCSMCYGDVDHGRDGYYLDWLRDREDEEAHLPRRADPRRPACPPPTPENDTDPRT